LKSALLSFFLFTSVFCSATFQRPDYLIVENDSLPILSRISELTAYKDLVAYYKTPGVSSTNCYVGYYVYLKLQNDSLFLDALVECVTDKKIPLDKLQGKNPRFYSWFSGEIILGQGKYYEYSTYEQQLILTIKNGLFQSDSVYVDSEKIAEINMRNAIYSSGFAIADSLEEHLNNYFSKFTWCTEDEFPICEESYSFKLTPKGKVRNVRFFLEFFPRIAETGYRIIHPGCVHQLKRSLKDFPFTEYELAQWPIYFTLFILCDENTGKAIVVMDQVFPKEDYLLYVKHSEDRKY
jgi:hypothetical protein